MIDAKMDYLVHVAQTAPLHILRKSYITGLEAGWRKSLDYNHPKEQGRRIRCARMSRILDTVLMMPAVTSHTRGRSWKPGRREGINAASPQSNAIS